MEKRSNKGLIVLLIIIILGLCAYIGYDKFVKKDAPKECTIKESTESTKQEETYTYKSLAGLYRFEKRTSVTGGNEYLDQYSIYLYDNGQYVDTYVTVEDGQTTVSGVGNYVIDGNTITLYQIAETLADAVIMYNEKKVEILDENKLHSNSKSPSNDNITSYDLEKVTDKTAIDEYLKRNDIKEYQKNKDTVYKNA